MSLFCETMFFGSATSAVTLTSQLQYSYVEAMEYDACVMLVYIDQHDNRHHHCQNPIYPVVESTAGNRLKSVHSQIFSSKIKPCLPFVHMKNCL